MNECWFKAKLWQVGYLYSEDKPEFSKSVVAKVLATSWVLSAQVKVLKWMLDMSAAYKIKSEGAGILRS